MPAVVVPDNKTQEHMAKNTREMNKHRRRPGPPPLTAALPPAHRHRRHPLSSDHRPTTITSIYLRPHHLPPPPVFRPTKQLPLLSSRLSSPAPATGVAPVN
ncbi:hypothetical protein Hanom_Chr02g00106221 [Helianthus anomalus]